MGRPATTIGTASAPRMPRAAEPGTAMGSAW